MNRQFNDLGLGTKVTRLVNKNGTFNVRRAGQPISFVNLYQWLIRMPWVPFLLLMLLMVFLVNSVFASVYFFIGPEYFSGIEEKGAWQQYLKCLFFSLQTFTTVGYGYIAPQGFLVNFIAALEALTGLMVFAIITGLLYGRFAKPSAQFIYSKNMLVSPFQGGQSLQFRIINKRKSMIMDLRARMLVSFQERGSARVYRPLELERESVVLFPLNWTVVHPISEQSPLFGKTKEELRKLDAEFIIVLKGYDETFSQEIHSLHSYRHDEILWNSKFNVMYEPNPDGSTTLHVDQINSIEML